MITNFPVKIKTCRLFVEDFFYFFKEYQQIVLEKVVTAQKVRFVNLTHLNSLSDYLQATVKKMVMEEQKAVVAEDGIIFLHVCDNGEIVSIVSDLDPLVLQKASVDWLFETAESITGRLLRLKTERINLETGLLNQHHLNVRLQAGDISTLFLLELPPARSGSRYIFSHLQAACNSLATYIQTHVPVYYLGNSLFAISGKTAAQSLIFAEALVAYLRREGFRKVHVGVGDYLPAGEEDLLADSLLDQGWTALQEAVRRGPFSFCSYSSLLEADKHPLASPPSELKKRFSVFTRKHEKFSVILFASEKNEPFLFKRLEDLSGTFQLYNWNDEVVCVLPNTTPEDALVFARTIIETLEADDVRMSAGLSYFPQQNFSKVETLVQARKALVHTAFYGVGTATLFDAVSCNVSGDVYYGEGNFIQAAKEYRTGLTIDPQEVNLLNSLGVAYAMMGKKQSLDCFEKAVVIDPDNLMALYNIGLFYLTAERGERAVDYFEKALQVVDCEQENSQSVRLDIQLQLGILCSKMNRAERAVELLLPLTTDKEFACKHNILFYLGKSYADAGRRKEAIPWLQKAVTAKCFEDQTLSLLGYLYLLEGQGTEIALSLCRKSVALNPVDHTLSLRLAEVLIVSEEYDEALLLIRKSMRKKLYRKEADRLLRIIKKNARDA